MTAVANAAERKTELAESEQYSNDRTIIKTKKKLLPNVLNNYRSVTYNFTLSAVPDEWLDNARYRFEEPKYIILKSGGKGSSKLALPTKLSELRRQEINESYQNDFADMTQLVEGIAQEELLDNEKRVEGFNKSSPGRFDMFIDELEIKGIMTFGNSNGASLATKMNFTVLEPYSINGFIEALHVASLSAGYTTYANGAFLLKIDFWGFPDDVPVEKSLPVKIKNATKYILFGFSAVKVDITALGTRYECSAVMFTDRALGNPNVLKKPISMEGATVQEVLDDLCKNLEAQVKESDNESRPDTPKLHDKYQIKFPLIENGKYLYDNGINKIGSSKLSEFNKSNVLSAMPDPGNTNNPSSTVDGKKIPSPEEVKQNPNIIKYSPNSNIKIQFNQGRNLNECIEAIIVDSDYVKKELLAKFQPDENGLVNYFLITPEITNQKEKNPQTKDYYKIYTFVISEYKIHYTRIPGFQSLKFDTSNIANIITKEYNYIYTGKNTDVLNFKLNFNNLFYESIPFALANNEVVGARNTAANNNNVKVEYKTENPRRVAEHAIPVQPTRTDPTPIEPITGAGGQLTDDPYQILARNLHEAIINAGVSGAQGDLEILGDPFFISTTGTGNYKAKIKDGFLNVTEDNEIDVTFGEVYIIVIFRNPVDLNKFEKIRVPFSGVYLITNVTSSFKNGVFKQDFKLIRIPAQIPLDDPMKSTDPRKIQVTVPDPTNQVVPDTTPAVVGPGIRPDPTQIRIPTVNSGLYNLASRLVNPVIQGVSELSAASSVFSLSQSRLSEGIRLAANNIDQPLSQLASLRSAGETLGTTLGTVQDSVNNTFASFANNSTLGKIVKGLPNTANLINNIGSKIESGVKDQSLIKLAGTLGIEIEKLTALGKEKLDNLKNKAEELSVNIRRLANSGVQLNNIPLAKLENLPPIAPPSTAPVPEIPLQDLQGLNLAKAFGVNDITKIPNILTKEQLNQVITAGNNLGGRLLELKQAISVDQTALRTKFGSVIDQTSNLVTSARQSLESSQAAVGLVNIKSTVELYGSKVVGSPLDKLISPVKQNTDFTNFA